MPIRYSNCVCCRSSSSSSSSSRSSISSLSSSISSSSSSSFSRSSSSSSSSSSSISSSSISSSSISSSSTSVSSESSSSGSSSSSSSGTAGICCGLICEGCLDFTPPTLYATLTDVSGCSCLDGDTAVLEWNGVDRWQANFVSGGGSCTSSLTYIAVWCIEAEPGAPVWHCLIFCGVTNGGGQTTQDELVCDPFYVRFGGVIMTGEPCNCCCGILQVEVTL